MQDNLKIKHHYYDVIIIGTGGSGINAAINSAERGFKVCAISKVHPLDSQTSYAQGGINASLGNVTIDDWRWHMYDTIKASDWLADQDAVEFMCKNASDAIKMLDKIGVEFHQNDNNLIDQKTYGGKAQIMAKDH